MSSSFVSIIPIKILFSITISTIPFPTSKHQLNNLEIKIVHSSPTLLNENRIIIQIQRQYLAQTASPSASSVRIRAKTLNGQTAIGKCLLATIARCACGIPAYTLHTFPWPRRTSVCHFFPIHYQHTCNAKHDQCSALIYWTETDNVKVKIRFYYASSKQQKADMNGKIHTHSSKFINGLDHHLLDSNSVCYPYRYR